MDMKNDLHATTCYLQCWTPKTEVVNLIANNHNKVYDL